jgi:hypothetical protein
MEAEGILGVPSVFTSETFSVRQNENIYKAHSILLGNKELMINHDRYGLFRPTIDPNTGNGKEEKVVLTDFFFVVLIHSSSFPCSSSCSSPYSTPYSSFGRPRFSYSSSCSLFIHCTTFPSSLPIP